ncbi:hypothetical protein CVT26_003615, partial [Gymnopilus dilepis]
CLIYSRLRNQILILSHLPPNREGIPSTIPTLSSTLSCLPRFRISLVERVGPFAGSHSTRHNAAKHLRALATRHISISKRPSTLPRKGTEVDLLVRATLESGWNPIVHATIEPLKKTDHLNLLQKSIRTLSHSLGNYRTSKNVDRLFCLLTESL